MAKTRLIGLHRRQRKHRNLLKITVKGFYLQRRSPPYQEKQSPANLLMRAGQFQCVTEAQQAKAAPLHQWSQLSHLGLVTGHSPKLGSSKPYRGCWNAVKWPWDRIHNSEWDGSTRHAEKPGKSMTTIAAVILNLVGYHPSVVSRNRQAQWYVMLWLPAQKLIVL